MFALQTVSILALSTLRGVQVRESGCEFYAVLMLPSGRSPPSIKYEHSRWKSFIGSESCTQLVKGWLQGCQKNHVNCQRQQRSRPPSRLLDLNSFESSLDIRLIDSQLDFDLPYVTLSWCWGRRDPVKLMKRNLELYLDRMKFDTLPKTFQDAISLVRMLGFSYLWIDALCIVQDDDNSFQMELSRMDEIYAGSICTIAAADALDCYQGFLQSRWPLSNQDCWLTVEGNVNLIAAADDPTITQATPGFCKLDGRAWVCQERMLSPRTIYYGEKHIYWECREKILHEKPRLENKDLELENSVSAMNVVSDRLKNVYLRLQLLKGDVGEDNREAVIRRNWHLVVSFYTRAKLSHGNDKLKALAGAASILKNRFGLKATFGLWLDFFLTELLWRSITPNGKPAKSRAPSWSWAALDDTCIINDYVMALPYEMDYYVRYPWSQRPKIKAELISVPPDIDFIRDLADITNIDPFAVRLRGPFQAVDWQFRASEHLANSYIITTPKKLRLEKSSDHEHNHWNFKPDYPVPDGLQLSCLLVTEYISDTEKSELYVIQDKQLGLVLTKLDGPETRYRRVGLYVHKFDSKCEACKIFTIETPIEEVQIV